ncbi:hypothetical protein GUITHDRAFT_107779 [Guillardia theta CCMP2712]|uniref:Uncharacterized protein n=1 Tax=Guillardia theta (strain CCMP2712) TaxID=905079 RepID=L1JEL1_GUITC|nr:hypothetical protein GUITHDRAFT_107779 [Guillardia theta CCMP2712]EKX46574.1 hypothetical protein GUITHDRAFT_107779 [Guillardia theta CCMP2712]|eukprot:XP_005833554.1 hypothetical protein GUITHDRAFT_107779 [Guillardia theta CCMP2712]
MDLLQWLLFSGGHANKIAIANFTHGGSKIRGLKAVADIPANFTLIEVPRALFISGEDIDPRDLSFPVLELQESSDVLLAVKFWQEFTRGRRSQWFPYLKVLPSAMELSRFHPMYADDVVLQACSVLPTMHKVRRAKRRVEKTYISRSYGVVLRSRRGGMKWQPVSVPLADMGNTALQGDVNTRWRYDSRSQVFLLESTRAIPAGSELLESYQVSSLKDNAHLAYMYLCSLSLIGIAKPSSPQLPRFGMTMDGNPVKRLTPQECLKLEEDCLSAGKEKLSQLLRTLVSEHCGNK